MYNIESMYTSDIQEEVITIYKALISRLPNFFRYVNKVYQFSKTVSSMKDKRPRPETSAQTTFTSVFLCALLRLGSIRRLAFEAKNGRIRKFIQNVDTETFCANTINNGLENTRTDILERELTVVPKKLRRNKAYGTAEHPRMIGGLKIVATDGTEIYRSTSISCDECLEYHVKTKEGIKTHYVHKIVIMQIVGRLHASAVQAIMGIEKILPKDKKADSQGEEGHEGEGIAAMRLVDKMIGLYGSQFFDVVTTDALYTNEPFVEFMNERNKYIVSRVKNERTNMYKEIESLSKSVVPIHKDDRDEQIEYWIYEIPHLEVSIGWQIPIRGFKIIEKHYKIKSSEKIYTKQETFLCMSSIPNYVADGDIIRQIVHAKWGIENNGIKDLKDNWHLTHNFHHHPNAIYAMLLILMMAYNLFYSYVFRHTKTYRLYQLTMKQIVEEFVSSFLHWKYRMSWVTFDGYDP